LHDHELYLSVIVLGEIRMGIEQLRRRDRSQADMLERWCIALGSRYSGRILPVTSDIAEEWARLSVPDPVPIVDGLIAATAKVHGMTLVTRATGQFERRGVRVLNPFLGSDTS
jgi:predicted nucleic acid-binding protein